MGKEEIQAEAKFLEVLFELNYLPAERRQERVKDAEALARLVPQFRKWPEDKKQFWNAEALCWKTRIDRSVREALRTELAPLTGRNLDLGAGSFSYVPDSVAVDISEEMLQLNDQQEKVVADLEQPLPFGNELFDSVTMVFVANYIRKLPLLLAEAKRVLTVGGKLVIVQPLEPVMELHRMHYQNGYGEPELKILLKQAGFRLTSSVKRVEGTGLLFLRCERGIQ